MPSQNRDSRERELDNEQHQQLGQYFLPGDGIEREVIQQSICHFLGRDALVRPGLHQGVSGFWIKAYRNLTTPMVETLKSESLRYLAENRARNSRGNRPVPYDQSTTYAQTQTQSTYMERPPVTSAPPIYPNYPSNRQYDQYDSDQPMSGYYSVQQQQQYDQQNAPPVSAAYPPPPNYMLSNQDFPNQRREFQGMPAAQQYYEPPRTDNYSGRTPPPRPDEVPVTRAQMMPHSQPQYEPYSSPPVRPSTQSNYYEQPLGQTVYMDQTAYESQRRAQNQGPPRSDPRSRAH